MSGLQPGDTLYVRSGTYLQTGTLSISRSGTSGSPINIATYPGDAPAIISGDTNGDGVCNATDVPGSQWGYLVNIAGSYVNFSNMEVRFSGGRGLTLSGTHSTASNCKVHHAWDIGIWVIGPYNTVQGCEVYRGTEFNYGQGGANNWSSGIVVGASQSTTPPGSGAYAQIRNNIVYHNSGEGIELLKTDYALVEGNVCYDNWAVQGIYSCNASYTTIRNNLVYWTGDTTWSRWSYGSAGILVANEYSNYPIAHDVDILNNIVVGCSGNIAFWSGRVSGGRMISYLIANNTCVNSANGGISLDAGYGGAAHSGTRIANNLVLEASGTLGAAPATTGLTFDHNLWSRTPAAAVSSTTDVIGNPLLVDPDHARGLGQVVPDWYKLTAGSPALAKGTSLSDVAYDYFGAVRTTPADIGAHEYTR